MKRTDQVALKIALQINQRLTHTPQSTESIKLPRSRWKLCEKLLRQTMIAEKRHWMSAEQRCRRSLMHSLQELRRELQLLESQIAPVEPTAIARSTVPEVIGDLWALHQEFEVVEMDLRERTVSVTTEPLTLDGVYLGPFHIELCWKETGYGNGWRYRIVADDPHPAASNEDVTHPHVQSESLCEGDGSQPLRAALETGRLFDFFTLVANILRTYNAASPYIALKDWDGISCSECGCLMDADEWCSCAVCSTAFCNDCRTVCLDCEDDFCVGCMKCCASCEEYFCKYCLQLCRGCCQEICGGCTHENERCDKCYECESNKEAETRESEQQPREPVPAPNPAIQSPSLGETAVSP